MGCEFSSPKPKEDEEKAKSKGEQNRSPHGISSSGASRNHDGSGDKDSLDVPVPREDDDDSIIAVDDDDGARGAGRRSATSEYMQSASHRRRGETPSPQRPSSHTWAFGGSDFNDSDDNSSSSSAPQLFRITPTNRAEAEEGTWAWWVDQVRRERVTRDGHCRSRLQDLRSRLISQHEEEPAQVELDLSRSYMERSAPYILGTLFVSPQLKEVRWITSLRLDGNYFTDQGLGSMLATMSEANERQTIMPLVEQLYLNSMNLDRQSVIGILFYLFPVNFRKERSSERRLGATPELSKEFASLTDHRPKVPLFPALSILSLSDNPGIGSGGLAAMLRWLLAAHNDPHVLSALDLSRCGLDRTACRVLAQYFDELPKAIKRGRNPVMPRSLVLLGNDHGVATETDLCVPTEIRVVL